MRFFFFVFVGSPLARNCWQNVFNCIAWLSRDDTSWGSFLWSFAGYSPSSNVISWGSQWTHILMRTTIYRELPGNVTGHQSIHLALNRTRPGGQSSYIFHFIDHFSTDDSFEKCGLQFSSQWATFFGTGSVLKSVPPWFLGTSNGFYWTIFCLSNLGWLGLQVT